MSRKFLPKVENWLAASFKQSIVIRALNWLQTSKWVLLGSSFLALLVAWLLFPVWLQIFTYPNRTIELQLSAPKGEVIRTYWDEPNRHPEAYTSITVNSPDSQQWQVKFEALAEKNLQASSNQITILDISTSEQTLDWSQIWLPPASWQMVSTESNGTVPGISSNPFALKIAPLIVRAVGNQLRIKLLCQPNAGKVKLTVNNEIQVVDLYGPENRIEELHFPSPPGQSRRKNYEIKIVDTAWHRLQFLPESQRQIRVRYVQIGTRKLQYEADTDNVFILPRRFWHRSSCAAFATGASWLVMTLLFTSTVHLWQGLGNRYIGNTFYILTMAVCLGGFWMLVFYPTFMTLDSMNQWHQALQNSYHNWFPPVMAMTMHLSMFLSKGPDLFTFAQGTFFWVAILFLLRKAVTSDRIFLVSATVLMFLPTLWIYGVTLVNNTWTATFALLSTALLIQSAEQQSWKSFWFSIFILSLSICFRHEAIFLVLLPILVSQFTLAKHAKLMQRLVHIGLILCLALVPSRLITKMPGLNTLSSTSYVFIGQYVGTLVNAKPQPAELADEKRSIDQQLGVGSFDFFIQHYDCSDTSKLWLDDKMRFPNTPENTAFVFKKVLTTAIRHPIGFIQHRTCNLSHMLQIPNISYFWGIVGDPTIHDIQIEKAGIEPNSRISEGLRRWVFDTIATLTTNPFTSIIFLHYLFLIVLVFNLLIGLIYKNIYLSIPSLTGLVYFTGFLIPDSFPDWRYLLLCYLCSLVSIVALVEFGIYRFQIPKSTP